MRTAFRENPISAKLRLPALLALGILLSVSGLLQALPISPARAAEQIQPLNQQWVEISSYRRLIEFRDEFNSGGHPRNVSVRLTSNIIFPAHVPWGQGIGTNTVRFEGTFDGANHTVINLRGGSGLFGTVQAARVQNVFFQSPVISDSIVARAAYGSSLFDNVGVYDGVINNIDSPVTTVGGIVGRIESGSLSNVHFLGSINVQNNSSDMTAGGIVGRAAGDLLVNNAFFEGSVTAVSPAFSSCAAGIIGEAAGDLAVIGARASGEITSFALSVAQAGGIAGILYSSVSDIITDVYFYGGININSISSQASGGGIAGVILGNFSITGARSWARIESGGGAADLGGIVGGANGTASVNNSSFDGSITSGHATTSRMGGVVGRARLININNTKIRADITGGGGNIDAGGAVGRLTLNGSSVVRDVFADVRLSASGTGNVSAGGVFGHVDFNSDVIVERVFLTGTVEASDRAAGIAVSITTIDIEVNNSVIAFNRISGNITAAHSLIRVSATGPRLANLNRTQATVLVDGAMGGLIRHDGATPRNAVWIAGQANYTAMSWTFADNMWVMDSGRPVLHRNPPMPNIISHPRPLFLFSGGQGTLRVTAASVAQGTLSYQWYSNTSNSNAGGQAVAGAVNNTFVPPVAASGTVWYYAVITHTVAGRMPVQIRSSPAPVTVTPNLVQTPVINLQPVDRQVDIGRTVTLSVGASVADGGVISYQWFSNINNSPFGAVNLGAANGANTPKFSPPTNTAGTVFYFAEVTSTLGGQTAMVVSNIVAVIVMPPHGIQPQMPAISLQLAGAHVNKGEVVILRVSAQVTDGGALTFQWFSNTVNSIDGAVSLGSASGAQTSEFRPPTDTEGRTYYFVEVTNTLGGRTAQATSYLAAVTVTPPPLIIDILPEGTALWAVLSIILGILMILILIVYVCARAAKQFGRKYRY